MDPTVAARALWLKTHPLPMNPTSMVKDSDLRNAR